MCPSDNPTSGTNIVVGDVHGYLIQARDITGGIQVHLPPAPTKIPHTLPIDVGLLSREQQLESLSAAVLDELPTSRAVVISGPPGVGKSQLAIHWAHSHANRFPDGQLFIDVQGYGADRPPLGLGEVASNLLSMFGVPAQAIPEEPGQRAAIARDMISSRRAIIILDNVRNARQVLPVLASGESVVVITSRDVLEAARGHGLQAIDLEPFDIERSVGFLEARLGGQRSAEDAESLRELATYCSGLPIALTLLSAHFAVDGHLTLVQAARDLRDHRRRLDYLDSGEPEHSIRSIFSWSVSSLTQEVQDTFAAIGALGLPAFDADSPAAFLDITHDAATATLRTLRRTNLITMLAQNRYGVHDLLLIFASERAHARWTGENVMLRYGAYLRSLAERAYRCERIMYPQREDLPNDLRPAKPLDFGVSTYDEAYEWFTSHIAEIRVATARARQAEVAGRLGWLLSWSVTTYLDRSGLWEVYVETQEHGLATVPPGRPELLVMTLRTLATALLRADRPDEAEQRLHQALSIDGLPPTARARTLLAFAFHYDAVADYRKALSYSEQAYHRYIGDTSSATPGAFRALSFIAWFRAHAAPADIRTAATEVREAIAGLHQVDYTWELGHGYYHLGFIEATLDDPTAALAAYRKSADYFAQLGATFFAGRSSLAAGRTIMEHSIADEDAASDLEDAVTLLAPFGGSMTVEAQARLRSVRPI